MDYSYYWMLDEQKNVVRCTSEEDFANAWAEDKRRIGATMVGDVRISTVFLPVNHALLRFGPPVCFETMVFGGALDQEQERCSTHADALAMHERWVERVRSGWTRPDDH